MRQRASLKRSQVRATRNASDASRSAHRCRRHSRTGQAGDMISDQSHNDYVRSRRDLRNREAVGELPIAHPMHHLNRNAMHFRNRRVGAANRKQRQQCKIAGQRDQRVVIHRFTHANAMLTGASTANTNGSGHCMMATPIKAAIATRGAQSQRLRNNRCSHFGDHRDKQADSSGRDAGEDTAKHFKVAETRIENCKDCDDNQRRSHQAGKRDCGTRLRPRSAIQKPRRSSQHWALAGIATARRPR